MDGVDPGREYALARCLRCRNILVVHAPPGGRKCPRCGAPITAQGMLSTRRFTAREASEVAKALKLQEHAHHRAAQR